MQMQKMRETDVVNPRNEGIDNGLARISGKIRKKEIFGGKDLGFVNFLLRKKLSSQECRSALSCLYLHLNYGRMGVLYGAERTIMELLRNHRGALEIPDIQFVPNEEMYN